VRKEDTIFRAVGTEDIDQQLTAISERDLAAMKLITISLLALTVIPFHYYPRNS
jgi:hypothetical protein